MVRRLFSLLVDAMAWAVAALHVVRYRLLRSGGVATFQHASEGVSPIPQFFGYRVRERFYRRLLPTFGQRVDVNYGTTIAEQESRFGNDIWIGPFCYLDLVDIQDQVLIGPHVCILAGGRHHRMERIDIPIRLQGNNPLKKVCIGYGAWIGASAVVMADVGEGAVVGAGSVVTRPVPAFAVVAGNPAQVLRYRTTQDAAVEGEPSEIAGK